MIRILVRVENAGMAANVGSSVESTYKSFDVDIPEMEKYLRAASENYCNASVVGVELLEPNAPW